jgi:hypothetical protein
MNYLIYNNYDLYYIFYIDFQMNNSQQKKGFYFPLTLPLRNMWLLAISSNAGHLGNQMLVGS